MSGGRRAGTWARLWAAPSGRVGLILVGALVVCAAGADFLAPGDPAALGAAGEALRPPGPGHPLGTDPLGRDVLTRLVHGARVSLLVSWAAVAVAVVIGAGAGLAAALGPAATDRLVCGLMDVLLAFPRIFLVLLLVSLTSPSLGLVMVVLGLTGWMGVGRLVRAEALSLRERDFVLAARGLGLTEPAIAVRHVLPNVVPTLLVATSLRIGGAVLLESFLSFLGLGAQEPTVSWGAMINQGRTHLLQGWWLAAFPGLAIAATVVGYNLLADGLREALDPRSGGGGRG